MKSKKDIAQMESSDVDLVSDFKIGERPRSVKYIRRADLAVEMRRFVRGEKGAAKPGEGWSLGSNRGAGICGADAVD